MKNELTKFEENNLVHEIKAFKIKKMSREKDMLFILLDNNQAFITNGKNIYDVTGYHYFVNYFEINNKLCAVLIDEFRIFTVIELENKEILFSDRRAYIVGKNDEHTLQVNLDIKGNLTEQLYDIEKKQYLPYIEKYDFVSALGNGLYFYKERNSNKNYDDLKGYVINIEGKIILNDIIGWVYLKDNYLIILNNNPKEIKIVNVLTSKTVNVSVDDDLLTEPIYDPVNGKIVLINKNIIHIYTLELELEKNINVSNLEKIKVFELLMDYLIMAVPINDKIVNVIVNLKNNKVIKHDFIEHLEYWNPETFIGEDYLNEQERNFSFYDEDFNLVDKVIGYHYYAVDKEGVSIFVVESKDKKILIDVKTGAVKETTYNLIEFSSETPYAYGVNFKNETMDFLDENFNIIIKDLKYKEYGIVFNNSISKNNLSYYIINNVVCLNVYSTDEYDYKYNNRTVMFSLDGEIIFDTMGRHQVSLIGNYIEITDKNESHFMNTITKEYGSLSISGPINSDGNLNMLEIKSVDDILKIENKDQALKLGLTKKDE